MRFDDLISREYRALISRQHEETLWGSDQCYAKRLPEIVEFAKLIDAQTILDYGSGREGLKNDMVRHRLGFAVRCFDPGTVRCSLPEAADLVVSMDVLEHVEPDRLDLTLRYMFSLARKGMYLVIATRAARVKLADGSNAHRIVEPAGWWLQQLQRHEDELVIDRTVIEPRHSLRAWLTRPQEHDQ